MQRGAPKGGGLQPGPAPRAAGFPPVRAASSAWPQLYSPIAMLSPACPRSLEEPKLEGWLFLWRRGLMTADDAGMPVSHNADILLLKGLFFHCTMVEPFCCAAATAGRAQHVRWPLWVRAQWPAVFGTPSPALPAAGW